MFLPTYIYFLLCSGIILCKKQEPSQAQLLVTRAGQCLGSKFKEKVQFSEMSIVNNDNKYYVSGFILVKEDVRNGWSIRATKQKCVDIRNIDTCDFLRTFNVVTFACGPDQAGDLAALWGLFNHTEPRISCPVKAGLYKLDDYCFVMKSSYFAAAEAKISTSMFGYTLTFEGFDEEEERFLCASMYLQLTYLRNSPQPAELDEDLDGSTEDTGDTATGAEPEN